MLEPYCHPWCAFKRCGSAILQPGSSCGDFLSAIILERPRSCLLSIHHRQEPIMNPYICYYIEYYNVSFLPSSCLSWCLFSLFIISPTDDQREEGRKRWKERNEMPDGEAWKSPDVSASHLSDWLQTASLPHPLLPPPNTLLGHCQDLSLSDQQHCQRPPAWL